MELSELILLEPLEILPGVRTRVLRLKEYGIERMDFLNGSVFFKVSGKPAAVVCIPVPGVVMHRDLSVE